MNLPDNYFDKHRYRQRAHTKFAERLELNLLRFPAPKTSVPKA